MSSLSLANSVQEQKVEEKQPVSGRECDNTAAVTFISELLSTSLAGRHDEVLVQPLEVLSDSAVGIDATRSLEVEIESEDIVETEDTVEITLTGTVQNRLGNKKMFTLYFFMWREKSVAISAKTSSNTPGPHSRLIRFKQAGEQLPDSVFELNLYQNCTTTGYPTRLGQGRGYLVVGRSM